MKIAILSDSHDNIPNLEKALQWINKEGIKTIIHCGDLCAPSILYSVIEPMFKGTIHLVHGNVGDKESLEIGVKQYPNVHLHGQQGQIEISGKQIAFTHFPKEAKQLAQTGKYDYVFYGHTHRPWAENSKFEALNSKQIQNSNDRNIKQVSDFGFRNSNFVPVVNPGTLAGMFYKATFAVLDTKKNVLELKILERLS